MSKTYRRRCPRCKKMFTAKRYSHRYCKPCFREKLEVHYGMGA